MPLYIVIAYLIGFLPITVSQAILVETITKHQRRVSVKILAVAYAVTYVLQAAVYLFLPDMPAKIFINGFCTIVPLMVISMRLYRSSLLIGLFVGASSMIGALGEMLSIYSVGLIAGVSTSEVLASPRLVFFGLIATGFITTCILLFTAFICRQLQKTNDGVSRSYLVATMLTITSSMVITYVVLHTLMDNAVMRESTALCIVIALIGMNFFVLFLYRRMVQDTENKYRNLFADTPAGVCVLAADARLTVLLANKSFYEIMGFEPEKKKQKKQKEQETSLLALLPEDASRRVQEQWMEMKSSDQADFEYELPMDMSDGEKHSILVTLHFDRGGRRITLNVLDITGRKRMEEELRLSEERYKLALTQSGKAFFFFDVPSRTIHLSEELATGFGIPTEVGHMPDDFIAYGLVAPRSIDECRAFCERIIAGETSGEAIIACNAQQASGQARWYRIAFTSVLDAQGAPQSAIITYEDLQQQREKEIAGAWKQLNLLSMPEKEYATVEYDLTDNRLLSQSGGLFSAMPEFLTQYDLINDFILDHFIHEEDVEAYRHFLDRQRLLAMFEAGETEDAIEYRSLQSGSTPRWTSTSLQMIRDPYSQDVLTQLFIRDIHAEKVGQIEMRQNVEDLKKELESSRIKVMINQMQPHFLYNALSAIQTIVNTDPDYASRLIYDFTVHLRSSIKALSSDAPISFRDELKNIRAYLNIEQMRFGESLNVKYEIDCEDFSVIPLTIQPLAENAARHGIYPKGEEGGTVAVRSYETVSAYVIEVEDDGNGFDVDEVLRSGGDSVGLKSLIFRLKSLMDADVTIDSKLGVGTKATVRIPKSFPGHANHSN